jgi:hypothetical protein
MDLMSAKLMPVSCPAAAPYAGGTECNSFPLPGEKAGAAVDRYAATLRDLTARLDLALILA